LSKLRSPVRLAGGKAVLVKRILPLLPPHRTYVEVFGGGANLLLAKHPSPVEVYNDIDSAVVNFFRVLRDPEMSKEFLRKVSLMPYSREEFEFSRKTWRDCEDDVERALRWFVVSRQCFGGDSSGGWGLVVGSSRRGMAERCSSWLSAIELLPQVIERFSRVLIENLDFRRILELYDTEQTLFYCDPPYIHDTRKDFRYSYEMSDKDHEDLVRILLGINGLAVVSGYEHEIYEPLVEKGWELYKFHTTCRVAGRTRYTRIQGRGAAQKMQPRIECVWVKPDKRSRLF